MHLFGTIFSCGLIHIWCLISRAVLLFWCDWTTTLSSRPWRTPTSTICPTTAATGRFWSGATPASGAASGPPVSVSRWVCVKQDVVSFILSPAWPFTHLPLPAWAKHPQVSEVLLPPGRWRPGVCPQKAKFWWVYLSPWVDESQGRWVLVEL